jgi:hypothetical protein
MKTRCLAPDTIARQALGITNGVTTSTSQRHPQVHETAMSWRSTDKTTPFTPTPHSATSTSSSTTAVDVQEMMSGLCRTYVGKAAAAQHTCVPLDSTPLPPSGKRSDPSKKKYCSHWIDTGNSKFEQQGCLYKHIIPDEKTLREIGFRNVTQRRWLEKDELLKPSCLRSGGRDWSPPVVMGPIAPTST